ncbi:hypothetical protein LQF76_01645 [Gloeomargaritales cyanobacterium VI4D9]|nr:hypothetical protein LQF76_01645 [Gloeomargaritales cyanobacterium VI4D9]
MDRIVFAKKTDIYEYFCRLIRENPNWENFFKEYQKIQRYYRSIYFKTIKTKLNKVGIRLSDQELHYLLIFWEELDILKFTNLDIEYGSSREEKINLVPLEDYRLMVDFKVYFPGFASDILEYYQKYYHKNK